MPTLSDAAVRAAVKTDLDRTIFLEAGAGSGKTSCLVDRFVALVEKGGIPADRIAAITFTEKAAAELGDRVRHELHTRADAGSVECRAALDVLDRAAIGTLHAFAQRILNEHPIEAGLPPRVRVLDEIASQLAFEERWEGWIDELLDDPSAERPLRLLVAAGGQLGHLHDLAMLFDDSWDLVEDRVTGIVPDVPPVDVTALLTLIEEVLALDRHCTEADDKMSLHFNQVLRPFAERLRAAFDDDGKLELLVRGKLGCKGGRKENWDGIAVADIRDRCAELDLSREAIIRRTMTSTLCALAEKVATFTVDGARARQAAGELEFHDLLVLARRVLRDPQHGVGVRALLGDRYQRLLLDEFQDTDPIQIDLAVLIASSDPDAASKPWEDVEVEPGRLFFVGDPKQSIYRFRRADIAVFLRARDELVGAHDGLTSSFRTGADIVEWVNRTFGSIITYEPDSQPAYEPLTAVRTDAAPVGPPVAFVGVDCHDAKASAPQMREVEAADVVSAIVQAHTEGWSVQDPVTLEWHAPRWRDIAILLPARTSLPFLEKALDAANVPYRAETSTIVYGTREVRDLLQIARAVEDPTDGLAVVAALRTPALACGDDDLFTWHARHRGSWDHQRSLPDDAPADHPVAIGLTFLASLHRDRLWLSPSRVLERIVRERRLLEQATSHPRPRDLWRRLRFVLDQCRAWEESGGGTLRDYLTWAKLQSTEGTRVQETVLPETDDDAVRILTVHGAKGLEFPITVLSGMTTAMKGGGRGVQAFFPPGDAGWAIRLKSGMSTADFDAYEPIDEQMDRNERLRLLYVAATRARDHLIVSVHRKPPSNRQESAAEVIHRTGAHADLVTELRYEPVDSASAEASSTTPVVAPVPLIAFDEWEAELDAARVVASRRLAVSATKLAEEAAAAAAAAADAGLKKDARDLDLPPWQKGRYGTAIGRAVHAVMQTIDLKTGDGLKESCAAQAAAEGVLGKEDVIEQLCRNALDSDIVKRAADRPHWREVYVGVPDPENGILEGYIDLMYRDDDGLVIVDYKTDAWRDEAELNDKVERYAMQLRAYADAVSHSVGEPVEGSTLLFVAGVGASREVV